MRLKGTVNLVKGTVTLEGDLAGLTLSETSAPADPSRGEADCQRRLHSTAAWSTSS